jgi:hypothetical protein
MESNGLEPGQAGLEGKTQAGKMLLLKGQRNHIPPQYLLKQMNSLV